MNDLNRYYREVRSWLPCSRKQKDQILSRFRDSVRNYLSENPVADFEQIRCHFGTPEQIAGAYIEELGTAELLRSLRVRRRIVAIIAALAVTVLLIWGAAVAVAFQKLNTNLDGRVQTEIILPVDPEGGN